MVPCPGDFADEQLRSRHPRRHRRHRRRHVPRRRRDPRREDRRPRAGAGRRPGGDRRLGQARAARRDRQPLPHRADVGERPPLRGRLLQRIGLRRVRGHHHDHPLRRTAPGPIVARGRRGVPRLRRSQGGGRLRLPSHRLGSHRADPGPGAPRPDRGRLLLVQGVHDLRPAEARRLPDARRALARPARGRHDHGARREPRHDPVAHRPAPRRRAPGAEVPRGQPRAGRGERGHEPGHRPRAAHRRPDAHRARLRSGGRRRHPPRAGPGAADLRRDLPPVPVPDRRGPRPRRHGGREVLLQPAPARRRQPGTGLARARQRHVPGVLLRPRALPLR